jgi:hypothetical protein
MYEGPHAPKNSAPSRDWSTLHTLIFAKSALSRKKRAIIQPCEFAFEMTSCPSQYHLFEICAIPHHQLEFQRIKMRLLLFLGILSSWFASQVFATTLIVLRTDSQTVVAADSKVVSIEGQEAKRCKILVAPNHFFAAAGIFRQFGEFDSFEIAKRLLSTSASHSEIVASYKDDMLRAIPEAVKKIRSQAPEYFEAKIRDREAFQAVFGSSENGILRVSVIGFTPGDDGSISVREEDCPGHCEAKQVWFVTLGEHALIDLEVRNNHRIWKSLGVVGAINKLITLETEGLPAFVGGPISIGFLRRDGQAGWHQLGSCEHNVD